MNSEEVKYIRGQSRLTLQVSNENIYIYIYTSMPRRSPLCSGMGPKDAAAECENLNFSSNRYIHAFVLNL